MVVIYSPEAASILYYAREEAHLLKFDHIGTEHIVLGFLREPNSWAYAILKNLGIYDLEIAREMCSQLSCRPKIAPAISELRPSEHYPKVLDAAAYFKCGWVGSLELFEAVLTFKEAEGVKLLQELGVDVNSIAGKLDAVVDSISSLRAKKPADEVKAVLGELKIPNEQRCLPQETMISLLQGNLSIQNKERALKHIRQCAFCVGKLLESIHNNKETSKDAKEVWW